MYGKYSLCYKSPKNLGYLMHPQTVRGLGGLGTRLILHVIESIMWIRIILYSFFLQCSDNLDSCRPLVS